jgi:ATP-dependent DNA helicase RecG
MLDQLAFPWRSTLNVRELLVQVPDVGPWNAADHEREILDFKQTPETTPTPAHALRHAIERLRVEIVETAMSFANARGGAIVLGVRDRAQQGERVVPGVDLGRWVPDDVRAFVHDRTAPHLLVDVVVESVHERHVLVVHVNPGPEIYGTTSGVFKHRHGDRNLPLDDATMRALRAARGRYDWSAEPLEAGPRAVSRAALEEAAARLRRRGMTDLADLAEREPRQFLADTGLLDPSGRVRRAALLLYGSEQSLREHVPNWGVLLRTAASPGSEGTVLLRRDDARRPLVSLLDDLLDRLTLLVRVETIRAGAEQIELVDYPSDALRELLANAFAHRDWQAAGVVEIVHSPEELSISSPGGLLPTLHPSRLLRSNAARNSLLTREMARLRLAEQAGLGFDRVYRELARIGKPPPEVVDGPRFTVTLPGGDADATLARYVASQLPDELRDDVDVLLLVSHLRENRAVNAVSAAPLLQRSPSEVQRVLERMQRAQIVEPTRGTARRQQPSYRLAPAALAGLRTALRYRTESIDSDDRKLIRHLRRNGQLTNADVRDYLDCDIYTARNRLARLRQKGWIDFAPDSPRRGPDVVYVKLEKLDEEPPDAEQG